jgi:4-carboxymuconolactone decarboxylase
MRSTSEEDDMRRSVVALASFALAFAAGLDASMAQNNAPSQADIAAVSPALDRYEKDALDEGLWKRPGLSPRDRSLVTLSGIIASGQTILIEPQMQRALDNGLTPAELSEVITHLAFYAGWGRAMEAVESAKPLFAARGVGAAQLPSATPQLLPLDEKAEGARAAAVEKSTGPASPGLVRDTANVLFRDLWLRPDLKPRDRSLVTVSALIASGQAEQITFHLNRAMDNGLTRGEASEALSQLAYYAGWPKAFSAAPVFRSVFEKRASDQKTKQEG